jgi:hypothetical protein
LSLIHSQERRKGSSSFKNRESKEGVVASLHDGAGHAKGASFTDGSRYDSIASGKEQAARSKRQVVIYVYVCIDSSADKVLGFACYSSLLEGGLALFTHLQYDARLCCCFASDRRAILFDADDDGCL